MKDSTSISSGDPLSRLLPLPLLSAESIPPSPNRTDPPATSIDWLPNFAGYAWVAYGASSLLVISHFPSPLSPEETRIGPIFRQILDIFTDNSSLVSAVSWSPAFPSRGDLAAASGNRIWVFSHDSTSPEGSSSWRQNAVLLQCLKVEAIKWTGAGDGIIAVGVEVVLWKSGDRCWEIAWKFKTDLPQTLVSAGWSVEGPIATASYPSEQQKEGFSDNEEAKCVIVCQSTGSSECVKSKLRHPLPVSSIEWRPFSRPSNRDVNHVLLTCCLDGTGRLWSEVDGGKVKYFTKNINDHKSVKKCYYVVAVIELNQPLNGNLNVNPYMAWAMEIKGIFKTGEGVSQVVPAKGFEPNENGKCDWVIGFGPGQLIYFWAIHCLDDVSPLRFARVTLWKKKDLKELEGGHDLWNDLSNSSNRLFLHRVVMSRNHLSSAPSFCSFIQLLPCNSLVWSLLYTQKTDMEHVSGCKFNFENFLSCTATGILNLNGHNGKILQVSVFPRNCEVELAVSLDSNGLLLFWLTSSVSRHIQGSPTLVSAWELCGKLVTQNSCSRYTCLCWTPSIIDEELILSIGHAGGIDCFLVRICSNGEENVECHYLCTVPFTGHGPFECGPNNIFSIPLSSACTEKACYSKFMLLGIWRESFQAISWEISLHSFDSPGNHFDSNENIGVGCSLRFESTLGSKQYAIIVIPCSSQLPDPHIHDQVASFDVVCPGTSSLGPQKKAITQEHCSEYPAYIMATGCSDGTLKLWRSNLGDSLTSHIPWELVGTFVAHQGALSALAVTDCGHKIATICIENHKSVVSAVHIWELAHIGNTGTFLLADTLFIKSDITVLSWLTLGDGQLLLGLCSQNGFNVYAQRRSGGQTMSYSPQFSKTDIWICIGIAHTLPPIHDFLWGSRTTAVMVHDSYFCVVNPWLFLLDQKYHKKSLPCYFREKYLTCVGGPDKDVRSAIFSDRDNDVFKDLSIQNTSGKCMATHLVDDSMNNDHPCNDFYLSQYQIEFAFATQIDLISILDVVEKLGGSLPLYHPEALLMNIYSGKWKRAHAALRHLIEFLDSDCNSEKKFSSVKSSHTVPQILLSDYFEGLSSKSSTDKGLQWSDYAAATTSSSQLQTNLSQLTFNLKSSVANSASVSSFSNELKGFAEPIEKFYEFAGLTRVEKSQILAIVDLLCEVTNQHSASVYESLDEPGRSGKTLYIMNVKLLKSLPMLKMLEHSDDQRTISFQEYMNIVIKYWTTLRIQQLQFLQQYGRSATLEDMVIDSGMIGWAYHSDCQENLLTSVLSDNPSWPEMRSLGVGFWFTDLASLRGRMEKLARSQYLKNKDPKDCALLYIALNRLQVLAGLFKISRDEKDKPLVGFLLRNFQEDKNKAAALKNAYVLMGRHQLELAIAFFLLGGDTFSAISVCAKNLGDEQLALVLCRLVEGRGGSQGQKLIRKVLLPSAIEKGNCLLASLLEWELGNYAQSFMNILGFTMKSARETSALSTKHVAFLDPRIGIFCMMLATKNSMRNTVGEHYSAILCKWATLMIATSLNRCGLPLEALEYLSSSPCSLGAVDHESGLDGSHAEVLRGILISSSNDSSNWLSAKSSVLLEYQAKLNLAVQYIYKLIKEHLSWPNVVAGSAGDQKCLVKFDYEKYDGLLGSFWHKLYTCISQFEHKFSLLPSLLINMILVSLCNHGLPFIGNNIFHQFAIQLQTEDRSFKVDSFLLCSLLNNPLEKAAKEISFSVSRYLTICCMNCIHDETKVKWPLWYHLQSLLQSLSNLRAILRIVSCAFVEDLMSKLLTILDLVEYTLYGASFWFERNSKGLLLILQPLFITFTNLHTPFEVDMEDIKKLLPKIADYMVQISMTNANMDRDIPAFVCLENEEHGDSILPVPKDESCFIIGLCFWQHLSKFMKHKLNMKFDESEGNEFDNLTCEIKKSRFENLEPDLQNNPNEQIRCVLLSITNLLKTTFTHVSSYHIKQLASLMQNKLDQGLDAGTVFWLEKSGQSQLRDRNQHFYGDIIDIDKMSNKDAYQALWNIIADPDIVLEGFAQERVNLLHYFSHKPYRRWSDISKEAEELHNTDKTDSPKESSSNRDTRSSGSVLFSNRRTLLSSWQKNTILKEVIPFEYPREVYKRNGELLEALCINSMDHRQAAVSSNKKGIVFFNWQDDGTTLDPMDYIWPEADWPPSGWAGSEPTSPSMCVSPGVGHGSKNGAHVGIDGAGVSVSSRARPGRDLTGGGAFGIPGYAGIGASSLGWETQENFEEFVDPPTSVENISARALSSHPLMPFFLVGSSNAHIHLWEFGKDKASATYGAMAAANFPPPYSLASISSLQFDHWGHRFASAALDGTVCTWQLEVGGRSNVHPTESSLCFNGYASDVSYVTSSGSIIAVAGYSSTGVNVIIWDTLAPPMSSQAAIMCHEGGAFSLCVFDNDIGSGSISPVVVTGGKSGDVGLHDFRYIATGKSKRHKQFDDSQYYLSSNHDTPTENDDKVGELNSKGMIWYIPKAHTSSVTKISTIPNTSLFLTGSKDGDVKLWDAKRARLMYHWPKLHERNIFLQPSSRGFGGVVRVAVTDIQVVSHGFLTCGGDGSVKLVEL